MSDTHSVVDVREALGEALDALGELGGDARVVELTGNRDWAGLTARLEAAYAWLAEGRA